MLLSKEDAGLLVIDAQTVLLPHVLNTQQCTDRMYWMMQLAKTLGVPTLVTEQYPKGLGPTVLPLSDPQLSVKHLSKVSFSCAKDATILEQIKSMNKTQWVLVGIETHVCVLQTAIDLVSEGFAVYVVVDAVSARNELDQRYGLKRMKQHEVELVTAEMVFFEWVKQAGTPEFKSLSQTFLRTT